MTLDTIKNLKELITKTHESGFQRFIGLHLNISVEKAIKQSTLLDIETTNRHYDEARELGKKLGIAATLPPNFKVLDKTDICRDYINHPCSEPNETMYIQSNGDIHPCCYSTNIYGNIFNEKFDNIWYNKKYKLLRSTMNTAECLPDCRICGMTEHIDNINFSIKKGEKYREKNIKEKLLECLK
jgi:radical SAM protein with 4Fe4S-binding SPASM domain